jgi:hypothetical protein
MKLDLAMLNQGLLKLIADVRSIHQAGGGSIRLVDIGTALGVPLDDTVRQALSQRGDMIFRVVSASSGVFENRGTEMRLPTNVAEIVIPPVLAGTYTSTAESLILQMNSEQTIVGKTAFMSAPLESLSANQQQASVRVGGFLGGLLSRTIALNEAKRPG